MSAAYDLCYPPSISTTAAQGTDQFLEGFYQALVDLYGPVLERVVLFGSRPIWMEEIRAGRAPNGLGRLGTTQRPSGGQPAA
jgi:hypothetical protein